MTINTWWIISSNVAEPSTPHAEALALLKFGRSTFGTNWLALQARDAENARLQTRLYDHGTHPRQNEITLFCQAYRVGGIDLPVSYPMPSKVTCLVPQPLALP